ncbi:MAG TPA: 50S ribosomal protein L13 [Candidatus Binataceae bacterium]|nr:50S ribosomal protein L13 [Candidatus Binataceae bacterium]
MELRLTHQTKSISHENALKARRWTIIDADGRSLGRVATRAASILAGKHRSDYTAHEDTGDFVVIINAGKVKLTGNKLVDKVYYRHTEYPGGIRTTTAGKILESKKPQQLIEIAVRGMLPKNRLGRHMFNKLKVYAGAEHPHSAQQPQAVAV